MVIKDIVKSNKLALHAYHYLKSGLNQIKNIQIAAAYSKAVNPTISLEQARQYNLTRTEGPQTLLCNAPFTSLFINMNGTVNVCGYNKTFILGNINEQKLSDIWNGERHRKLQEAIRNFNLSNGCQACQSKIENGDYHRASIYFDSPKASKKYTLKKITFELSNTCNLECVMCNGELSSLIRKNVEHRPPLKQNKTDYLVQQLSDFIPQLEFVQFLGGEPLLIKPYYDIWDKIVRENPDCTISVQTNCTVLPKGFINLLDSSDRFIISVSIDSFDKENYERIRVRGDFNEVMKNFQILYRYKVQNKIKLFLNFVPMTINWHEIPVAVDFANKHQIILSMCEVESPYEYSFFSMASVELKKVIDFLVENRPVKKGNIFELHNFNLYNNQITQLKNMDRLVSRSEELFDLDKSGITHDEAMSQFEQNVIQLPVYNDKIKAYLKEHLLEKIASMDKTQQLRVYNEFNRYYYVRTSFFVQNKQENIETENFEGLVLNELKSIIKVILNKC